MWIYSMETILKTENRTGESSVRDSLEENQAEPCETDFAIEPAMHPTSCAKAEESLLRPRKRSLRLLEFNR
jgi:hypothetical protein